MPNIPRHVGIVMDGNGRWAERRGLPRWHGHAAGARAVRQVTEASCELGIAYLTLFAFSSENWKRPAEEVAFLFDQFARYLVQKRQELLRNGIRVTALGRRDRLSEDVREALAATEAATRTGRRLHLRLAIDYGGRQEIAAAARLLAWEAVCGRLTPDRIDEALMAKALSLDRVPDPDLVIRTGGEFRLSNFLLWQSSYAELYFSPVLWPDFGRDELLAACRDFASRTRKFGGLPADQVEKAGRGECPGLAEVCSRTRVRGGSTSASVSR